MQKSNLNFEEQTKNPEMQKQFYHRSYFIEQFIQLYEHFSYSCFIIHKYYIFLSYNLLLVHNITIHTYEYGANTL